MCVHMYTVEPLNVVSGVLCIEPGGGGWWGVGGGGWGGGGGSITVLQINPLGHMQVIMYFFNCVVIQGRLDKCYETT